MLDEGVKLPDDDLSDSPPYMELSDDEADSNCCTPRYPPSPTTIAAARCSSDSQRGTHSNYCTPNTNQNPKCGSGIDSMSMQCRHSTFNGGMGMGLEQQTPGAELRHARPFLEQAEKEKGSVRDETAATTTCNGGIHTFTVRVHVRVHMIQ